MGLLRERAKRHYVAIGCVLVGLAFAWLVWPTPYQYVTNGSTLLRVNRVTHSTAVWYHFAWYEPHARWTPPASDTIITDPSARGPGK